MKKSTIAVAALLTALSTAPVMSVAYADEQPASTSSSSCTGCKGCAGCKAAGDDKATNNDSNSGNDTGASE